MWTDGVVLQHLGRAARECVCVCMRACACVCFNGGVIFHTKTDEGLEISSVVLFSLYNRVYRISEGKKKSLSGYCDTMSNTTDRYKDRE